ncbi:hypothetical protein A9Q81_27585 [Gammaproteobacteria bacterium 42_54_T18]|nr:hypothetical protein A9Q81_27585 [Gammaproteobacteria bacterium 42_54_T18]
MDIADLEYSLRGLYSTIGTRLIEATPEHWNSAFLRMRLSDDSVAHIIESDEGHEDIVMCTDEILEASWQLERELKSQGRMFEKAAPSSA